MRNDALSSTDISAGPCKEGCQTGCCRCHSRRTAHIHARDCILGAIKESQASHGMFCCKGHVLSTPFSQAYVAGTGRALSRNAQATDLFAAQIPQDALPAALLCPPGLSNMAAGVPQGASPARPPLPIPSAPMMAPLPIPSASMPLMAPNADQTSFVDNSIPSMQLQVRSRLRAHCHMACMQGLGGPPLSVLQLLGMPNAFEGQLSQDNVLTALQMLAAQQQPRPPVQ